MPIHYYSDRSELMPPLRRRVLNRWIGELIEELGQKLGEINFQFTDDAGILRANRTYLDHDYYTDVITFPNEPMGTRSRKIFGDILIGLDTVATNSDEHKTSFEEELHRVMIHGVLHLLGLGDGTPEEKQAMRKAENKALTKLVVLMEGDSLLRKQRASEFTERYHDYL